MALLFEDIKDYERAESEADKAANIAVICLGDNHPDMKVIVDEYERIKVVAERHKEQISGVK